MRRATAAQIAAVVQPIAEPAPDSYDVRAMGAAGKLDLVDLDRDERAFLGICQDLYRNDRGCGTPLENFVRTIILWTTWGNPPKPEDLIDEIKDNFQPDWELTVHSVRRFAKNYPDLLREITAAPEPAAAVVNKSHQVRIESARKPRKKVKRAS